MALDYFTLADLRALADCEGSTFSDAQITAEGEEVQAIIESACQSSFVARSVTETVDGTGTTRLRLKTPYVLAITSVTVNGTALTDQFTVDAGILERRTTGTYTPQPWTLGRRNIVVVYTSGYSTAPPADIKGAALWVTRDRLLSKSNRAGIDARKTSMNTEFGTVNYVLAGENRPTGLPDADAIIMRWARKLNTVTYP
jgi:hypothetical protein